jgi:hypothetical protein
MALAPDAVRGVVRAEGGRVMAYFPIRCPFFARTQDAWHHCRSKANMPPDCIAIVEPVWTGAQADHDGYAWFALMMRMDADSPLTTLHHTQADAMRWVDAQVKP